MAKFALHTAEQYRCGGAELFPPRQQCASDDVNVWKTATCKARLETLT